MILVKFRTDIDIAHSYWDYSYFENLDIENYASLNGECFVSAPEGKYIDTLL